ncbi:hypothetical protein A2767_00695 [Candidatus Roizmanbacteria bacterium RIFCSPHIGHO2_01_FULL_35_10]|uniref:Uncharacterized protein n=1 Tax=Candidatus Roizmanbacteria bacterium RIFCSPLOWO2_01_FULL_35_13 TaxID=1802055 RepID=A0A1F7I916_9BACT|nr:MAG: hypothetical protein A2767_00695 [Candidatus Roizmanbacteria bacterium RIFCSPHIGHO2_01_FULL_35_10]OGK39857.1 MAG: hypothetical protein A3A74_03120 [Candidatus Roizmanbacteria bacterium RIFCSPLOWO2_01_FULL_35_13]
MFENFSRISTRKKELKNKFYPRLITGLALIGLGLFLITGCADGQRIGNIQKYATAIATNPSLVDPASTVCAKASVKLLMENWSTTNNTIMTIEPSAIVVRRSLINNPDGTAFTKVTLLADFHSKKILTNPAAGFDSSIDDYYIRTSNGLGHAYSQTHVEPMSTTQGMTDQGDLLEFEVVTFVDNANILPQDIQPVNSVSGWIETIKALYLSGYNTGAGIDALMTTEVDLGSIYMIDNPDEVYPEFNGRQYISAKVKKDSVVVYKGYSGAAGCDETGTLRAIVVKKQDVNIMGFNDISGLVMVPLPSSEGINIQIDMNHMINPK